MSVNVQVRLNRRWNTASAAVRDEFQRAGREAASQLTRAFKREIRAAGAVASAALVDSVSTRYAQRGSIQQFEVTAAAHWIYVERGRKPKSALPPVAAIAEWMRLRGLTGSAWAIAVSIARRGIRGRYPLRHAIEKTRPAMRAAFDRAVARLKGRFR
jgi:hypothetical protein